MMGKLQFEERLKHIDDQVQTMQRRVDGYKDQQLAKLFVESEWSQEKLAEELTRLWGKDVSQQWICCRLRFGRFLKFFTTSGSKTEFSLPANLTERAFRSHWEATVAGGEYRGRGATSEAAAEDERRRFIEVVEMLKGTSLRRKAQPMKRAIIARLAGKDSWMTIEDVRERISGDLDGPVAPLDVRRCLDRIKPTDKQPYRMERAGKGPSTRYRLVKIKGKILGNRQIAKYAAEVVPLLDAMIREAKKGRTEISLSELCSLASRIKMVFESVTATVMPEESRGLAIAVVPDESSDVG